MAEEWWRNVPDEAYKERVAAMSTDALQELVSDLSATLCEVSEQRQRGGPDADWLQRVRYLEAKLSARRQWTRAELASRNETTRTANAQRKSAMVAKMRKALDAGDLADCLAMIVDWLDPERK